MNLPSLPVDVLLAIFIHLEVIDLLTIRKTCKDLEPVTRDRSVWHKALSIRFLQAGIPIPGINRWHALDSELSAEQLEQLTIRAYRLWTNWTSPQPQHFTQLDIRPTSRAWAANARTRNLAVFFLPGCNGRYLLTLSLLDSSERDDRRYSFECWDLHTADADRLTMKPVAELLVAGLLGYSPNSAPESPHVLAVTRRHGADQMITTTYTIDFDTPGQDPWFRRTNQFDGFRTTLGLEGSHLIATEPDHEVRVVNVDSGQLLCSLKVTVMHNDPTLRFPEHQCLDYEIFDDFVITFCKQWIFLYRLPSSLDDSQDDSEDTPPSHPPRLDPIAKYKWRWRIDTITVNPRRAISSKLPAPNGGGRKPPTIDILIRFDTWYPWPVNILHHFVLPPNPAFLRELFSATDSSTFPYLAASADAPYMAHSIPSPLRLFTPSDLVLGPYGTALWLDASTDPTTPSQAGDHGQRIACKVIARGGVGGSPRSTRDRARTEDDVVSPGEEIDPALFNAMSLDGSNSAATTADASVAVMHVQGEREPWSRVAVNEEEGQVAVGHVDGRVTVYTYAPPV
ncbi:hypothetical protein C8Q80DRAFT_1193359 [Daedaleopsis nitida]|nr:hypothetical protein C8Q80DRAFT_1193359 [Daedaleopsis nitida]